MNRRFYVTAFAVLFLFIFYGIQSFIDANPQKNPEPVLSPEDRDFLSSKLSEAAATAPVSKEPATAGAPTQSYSSRDCMRTLESSLTETGFRSNLEQLLIRQAGPWLYSNEPVNPPNASTDSKLMYALAQMDGFERQPNIKPDLAAAYRLLLEVNEEDPDNSAPLVMALVIQDSLNNTAEVQKILTKIQKTTRFENPMYAVYGQVFDAVQTPENLIQAFLVYRKLPVLDYEAIGHVLKKYPEAKVGEQLIANGLNKNNKRLDIDWSAADYSLGLGIMQKLKPQASYPNLPDLYKMKGTGNSIDVDISFALIESKCSIEGLNTLVDHLKN